MPISDGNNASWPKKPTFASIFTCGASSTCCDSPMRRSTSAVRHSRRLGSGDSVPSTHITWSSFDTLHRPGPGCSPVTTIVSSDEPFVDDGSTAAAWAIPASSMPAKTRSARRRIESNPSEGTRSVPETATRRVKFRLGSAAAVGWAGRPHRDASTGRAARVRPARHSVRASSVATCFAASSVAATSARVCAVETNRFSYAPGWNSTPLPSIPCHQRRKISWSAWRSASR